MRLDIDPERWVSPTKYTIYYSLVDLERFVFAGAIAISLKPRSSIPVTQCIRLHSIGLEVGDGKLLLEGGVFVDASKIKYRPEDQIVEIYFENQSPKQLAGATTLTLSFDGVLGDNLAGLYRSFYVNPKGERRAMAVTQFEPTDARRAFPCFDDPSLKAVFQVSVRTHADRMVISNTAVTSVESGDDDWKIWRFAPTPIMSTYIMAIVVGDFDQVAGYTDRGVRTTVYTPLGRSEEGEFALNVATKALSFYEKEYGVLYPLGKQDLLAIPDFASGAMENWGCVTYREARVLCNEATSSSRQKLGVARVVSHELAHQWFGNLVTMKFWTDLWLNEGFARVMEFGSVNSIFPSWDVYTSFVQDIQSLALHLDSLKNTHPVRVEVQNADEINEIFDAISYAKGASILRMLDGYISHETFMNGVKYYLEKFAYSNAETSDLWESIECASNLPDGQVRNLMQAWTQEAGYPVILLESDGDNGKVVDIRIERYQYNYGSTEPQEGSWIIPIHWVAGDETSGRLLLDASTKSELIDIINAKESQCTWIWLNSNATGFFRVCYTKSQWHRLIDACVMGDKGGLISTSPNSNCDLKSTDRVTLVRDAFSMATSGYIDISIPLVMFQKMAIHESNAFVLVELFSRLKSLASLHDSQSWFEEFAAKVILPGGTATLDELGWFAKSGEEGQVGVLRGEVLKLMALVPNSKNSQIAVDLVAKHFSKSLKIDPDVRLTVLNLAVSDTTNPEALFDLYLHNARSESLTAEERRECLICIARCARHETLRSRVIDFLLNNVKLQDFSLLVNAVCDNHEATKQIWSILTQNYDEWLGKYGTVGMQWGSTVGGIVSGFETEEELKEVRSFFHGLKLGAAQRGLGGALEEVEGRIARKGRETEAIRTFLIQQ